CDTCQRRIAFALWLALTCCTPVSSHFVTFLMVTRGGCRWQTAVGSWLNSLVDGARTPASLETDLYDGAVDAYQPSRFRSRKSDRPIASHSGQREPCTALIGSPCRSARVGGDNHRASAVFSFLTTAGLTDVA